ncbi:envelope-like protein, partial [Trifolium pratense]
RTISPFDFGSYILDETILDDKSCVVKMHIVFPTLMCDTILAQHPDICSEADVPSKRGCDLSFDLRLFESTHAADCAASSVNQSTDVLARKQMIVDLKVFSNVNPGVLDDNAGCDTEVEEEEDSDASPSM